jgi:hypothetical protein
VLPKPEVPAHLIPARLAMIQKKVCVRAEARTHRRFLWVRL